MKKRSLFTVFTLALSLALSGCGAKETGTPSSGGASSSGSKTLLVQTDTDLSSMDTAIATDGTSFIAQALVFSGLTDLDANNKPMPELATSWDVNAEATVYTFHLADAKWSNGDPVTANDFVSSETYI